MGIQIDLGVQCDFIFFPVNLLPFIILKGISPFLLVQENRSVALGSVQH